MIVAWLQLPSCSSTCCATASSRGGGWKPKSWYCGISSMSCSSVQQRAPRRLHLRWADRALFIWLYRRCPRILDAIAIVRPETVVRWHRMNFAAYWRWKSRPHGGRPRIGKEVRDLIRRMSIENPLWGAPKIHGELLKLGIDVAQSTVSIYMVPRQNRKGRSPAAKTPKKPADAEAGAVLVCKFAMSY
jgi:hypothetical protein